MEVVLATQSQRYHWLTGFMLHARRAQRPYVLETDVELGEDDIQAPTRIEALVRACVAYWDAQPNAPGELGKESE